MGKGRKPNNALPECELTQSRLHVAYLTNHNTLTVVDVSEDGKKVRCKICGQSCIGQPKDGTWIKKESLVYHVKSDLHARSVIAQRDRESLQSAGEQSIREEMEMEERMDFVTLASTSTQDRNTERSSTLRTSVKENTLWDNCDFSNNPFSAGTDCTSAAVAERERLEREANDFDIWHGEDFLPEEHPNNGELLLDELEQDDVLNEILRNASKAIPFLYL